MVRAFLMLLALVFAASPVLVADSIAAILKSPATYDGKHVVVSGVVQGLREKTSAKGNAYDVFSLCAASCVHVSAFGRPHPTWIEEDCLFKVDMMSL